MGLSPGTRLGPYEVTAQIGVGGMGEVYRATDTNLGRPVAKIHGLEKSEGTIALVMELVEGPTLADRIAQGAIPLDEALPAVGRPTPLPGDGLPLNAQPNSLLNHDVGPDGRFVTILDGAEVAGAAAASNQIVIRTGSRS
jgi:hypothetical protein